MRFIRKQERGLEQFTNLTKKSTTQYISDLITDRLKIALVKETESQLKEPELVVKAEEPKVVTTGEELEAFYIIKSILRDQIDAERIVYRDAQSYFAILLDDNNRKTICRLQLSGNKKYIHLMDADKKGEKSEISNINGIYQFAARLIKTVENLEKSIVQGEAVN